MPTIASSKVTVTTILSQRKEGPWKQDAEKVKGTDSIL